MRIWPPSWRRPASSGRRDFSRAVDRARPEAGRRALGRAPVPLPAGDQAVTRNGGRALDGRAGRMTALEAHPREHTKPARAPEGGAGRMTVPVSRQPGAPALRCGARLVAAVLLLGLGLAPGCNARPDNFVMLPFAGRFKDQLLTAVGSMEPTRSPLCGSQRDDNAPSGSGSPFLLIDTATPLSVFVPAVAAPPLPFRHGEVTLRSWQEDDSAGALRVLACDTPMIRTDLDPREFRLDRGSASTGPLGGVIGGDLLGRFALTLRFAGTGSAQSTRLTFTRSDIGTSCQLDDAVLPFRPLGGQLAVRVGDAVLTYPATRITVAACLEPLSDPLRPGAEATCLDRDAALTAKDNLTKALNLASSQTPPDQPTIDRIANWLRALELVTAQECTGAPELNLTDLGNVVAEQQLLRPAFYPSGVDVQLLVSTALPDLILSETACQRLADPERCRCQSTDPRVKLRLPGLNPSDADAEYGCPVKLGSGTRTALALVARQRYLSACGELARARRQRYSLPSLGPRPALDSDCQSTSCQACRHEACLVNLLREPSMNSRRCGYSGPDPQYACDDHLAPVAAVVELGGPQDEPTAGPDLVEALVVPDTARILQSANADIRSDGPQVDGVIGLALLSRLYTTVDYPQTRVVLSCRCGDQPGHVCRAYRGSTYNSADSCSQDSQLQIPADYGRASCR